MRKAQKPLPREHGAWGLLLQPFVAAAVLARQWDWLLVPALLLVLLGFVVREALIILGRYQWAGHLWSETTLLARNWLVAEVAAIALCFAALCLYLPLAPLGILAGTALLLTLVSVWMTIKNHQRSVWLQLAAVGGLGSSVFLAALSTLRAIPGWAWWLWALLTVHGMVGVLCVHARLRLRSASKRQVTGNPLRVPLAALLVQAFLVIPTVIWASRGLAAVLLCSVLLHAMEIVRLTKAGEIHQSLSHTGIRMLVQSLSYTVLVMVGLWNLY
jgi:hypothetical protein